MKYTKCPCGKSASKKYGRVHVCDDCYKKMRRRKATVACKEKYVGMLSGLKVYGYSVCKV